MLFLFVVSSSSEVSYDFRCLNLSFWGYVLATVVLTQISIASQTIYLHRHQTHRALTLHPLASHFFRFWLWMTTGMVTAEYVAIHRKHHAATDVEGDPHSPVVEGIKKSCGKVLSCMVKQKKTKNSLKNIPMVRLMIGWSVMSILNTHAWVLV